MAKRASKGIDMASRISVCAVLKDVNQPVCGASVQDVLRTHGADKVEAIWTDAFDPARRGTEVRATTPPG